MYSICWCFQELGSLGASDIDKINEETAKSTLISQELDNEEKQTNQRMQNNNSFDTDEEKVKEYENEPFENQSDHSDDDLHESEVTDEYHAHTHTNTQSMASLVSLQSISTISETSQVKNFNIVNSVTEAADNDDNEESSYLSIVQLQQEDSLSLYNACPECINLQQQQKQLEIQLETIRDRNSELEDKIIETQTNEENSKRLYDEAKEDYDRIHAKYLQLIKTSETNKHTTDNILSQTRHKFETEIQNLEKSFQELLKDKNKSELELHQKNEKIENTENDLINLQNKCSILNVEKCRIEDDLKIELQKYEKSKHEYKQEIDKLQKDISELMQELKKEKFETLSEREKNEVALNILRQELKTLRSEIAEHEEEKKALQESITLYEKQMEAEQLMNNTQLDLINEDEEKDEENENELFISGTIVYDEHLKLRRKSKSHNMSISELEPATPALPIYPDLYLDLDENDIILPSMKTKMKLAAKSGNDLLNIKKHVQKQKRNKSVALNVWKDKYSEIKSHSTSDAKAIANKDIEIKSLTEKINSLQNASTGYVDKIQILELELESSHQHEIELHKTEINMRQKHEDEINVILKQLNCVKDECCKLESENHRYLQYKKEREKGFKKKDKAHNKQLKFNEELMNEIFDLNNEVKQLTDINIELKSKLETLMIESAESIDQYANVHNKLHTAVKERKEEKINNKRLKNKVNALNKESIALNHTISNLESLFSEHSHLLQSKNRRIKHLDKQKEQQLQSIHKLSSKLKKRDRHLKSFLAAEEDSFKKSYSAKDKRLGMLRETNKKLLIKTEESEKKLIELGGILNETKIKLKDEITNHRMDNKTLQFEISKLTCENNKIVSEKQEILYQKDKLLNEIEKEKKENFTIKKEIKKTISSLKEIGNSYFNFLSFLDSINMKEDNLYKFVQRCRNIFLNTNKLTHKLIMQLIEGSDRAICVYFHCITNFKLLIDNCLNLQTLFRNIEKTYTSKKVEFHCYELYQSALCSIYNIGGSSSPASNIVNYKSNRRSHSLRYDRASKRIINPKNKDVIPKIPLIAKDLIRKPIQCDTTKVPIDAYNEIYHLLSKHLECALDNLQNITQIYEKPLNLSIYNDNEDDNEDEDEDEDKDNQINEPNINWCGLNRDPSLERLYPGSKEINDKRFEQIMNEMNKSSKEFRKEQTKQLMELEGAWYRYHIQVGTRISSRTSPDIPPIGKNDTNHLTPLTLKVSSIGVHDKRYSIF